MTALAVIYNPMTTHPSYTGSYAVLRRRAHTLDITDTQLASCRTVGALQQLAKTHYRQLARQYHPDTIDRRRLHGRHAGQTFRAVAKTYHWLMALPEGLLPTHWAPSLCEILEHEWEDAGIFGWHIEYY